MSNKITVAFMRDLEKQVIAEEISYSRMVELLNERARTYDKEWNEVIRYVAFHENYHEGDRGNELPKYALELIMEGEKANKRCADHFSIMIDFIKKNDKVSKIREQIQKRANIATGDYQSAFAMALNCIDEIIKDERI